MSWYCSENSFESWTTLRTAASELLSFPVSTAFSYTVAHTRAYWHMLVWHFCFGDVMMFLG